MSHCVPSSELSIPSFLLCFSLFEDFFFVFFLFFICLCWVLVAAPGIFTVLWEIFSCEAWTLVLAHRLRCPAACGIMVP